jgi:hypothetical protein
MLNFFNKKKNVESGVVSVVSIDDDEDDSIMFFVLFLNHWDEI